MTNQFESHGIVKRRKKNVNLIFDKNCSKIYKNKKNTPRNGNCNQAGIIRKGELKYLFV